MTAGSGFLSGWLCRHGVELLGRTVRMEIDRLYELAADRLAGYWHGDSCGAMLLLRELSRRDIAATTVVTADRRGDAIACAIRPCGAKALRIRDGTAARRGMRELYGEAEDRTRLLALTLDGPTGPRHKPKRVLLRLSSRTGREVVLLHFGYSAAIRLRRRWDHYAIPLPFSKVTVRVRSLGCVTEERWAALGVSPLESTAGDKSPHFQAKGNMI